MLWLDRVSTSERLAIQRRKAFLVILGLLRVLDQLPTLMAAPAVVKVLLALAPRAVMAPMQGVRAKQQLQRASSLFAANAATAFAMSPHVSALPSKKPS